MGSAVGYGGGDAVLDATTRGLGDPFDRGEAGYTVDAAKVVSIRGVGTGRA